MDLQKEIIQLSTQLVKRRLTICTAESCTGGLISKLFTDNSGSSEWFDCAFVTYTNNAKQQMLGVNPITIESSGAVSQPTVIEMSEGAINKSNSNVSIAISGVAGPSGGTKEKPVGMVWVSWSGKSYETLAQCFYFDGDRESIRFQAAKAAIQGAVKYIVKNA